MRRPEDLRQKLLDSPGAKELEAQIDAALDAADLAGWPVRIDVKYRAQHVVAALMRAYQDSGWLVDLNGAEYLCIYAPF